MFASQLHTVSMEVQVLEIRGNFPHSGNLIQGADYSMVSM